MGTLNLIGSDGNATMPTGYKANVNTWSATFTRTTSVVTKFGDGGHTRLPSAVLDITGSVGGTPIYNASTTSPLGIASSAAAVDLTLFWDDTGGAVCSIALKAVFNSVALNVTNDGDSTVTFNFEAGGTTTAPTFTWEES